MTDYPNKSGKVWPFITIIMPVRNEAGYIRATLLKILTQDYPADRFEVIVADGMSSDATRDIVMEFATSHPQVTLVVNPGRIGGSGRNIGFRKGRGEYFLVVDGHCFIPDDDMLKNVVSCFERSGAGCLGRPQPLDPPGLTDFQMAVALARAARIGHGSDSLIYNAHEGFTSPVSNGAAYRRGVFEKVGYVDEQFDACEDVEFNYRVEKAGIKAYTSPSLTVKYYPRASLRSLFLQMARYGRGRCRFIRKHPEAFSWTQIVPALFILGICVSVLLLFVVNILPGFPRIPAAVLKPIVAAAALYSALVLGQTLEIAIKGHWRIAHHLPPIFLVIHAGLGGGFLREACRLGATGKT